MLIVDEVAIPLDAFKRINGEPMLGGDGWRLVGGDSLRLEMPPELAGDRVLSIAFDLEMGTGTIASYEVLELARARSEVIARASFTTSQIATATIRRSMRGDAKLVLKVAGGGNVPATLVGVYVRRVRGRG